MSDTAVDVGTRTAGLAERHPYYPNNPRFGAGRPKGALAKKPKRAQEIADEMGVDPIRWMLTLLTLDSMEVVVVNKQTGEVEMEDNLVMDRSGNLQVKGKKPKKRLAPISPDMKLSAAKDLAKYIHPALAATQVTGANDGPIMSASIDLNKLLEDPIAHAAAQALSLHMSGIEPPVETVDATPDE